MWACREKKSLEEELERMKLRANEIPILKERLDVHVGYEKKLQSEVTQRVVRELQTNNTELCDGLQIAHDAGKKQLECIRSLEGEVRQCVFGCAIIPMQIIVSMPHLCGFLIV